TGQIKNLSVVAAPQPDLAHPRWVMALGSEQLGQVGWKHLVQEQLHSSCLERCELSAFNGALSVTQRGLNVLWPQFRVIPHHIWPAQAFSQLLEDNRHRNARAPDDRFATTD